MNKKDKALKMLNEIGAAYQGYVNLSEEEAARAYCILEAENKISRLRSELLALIPGEEEIKKPTNKHRWWRGSFCSCCGKYPPLSDKYCGGCGSKLKWKDGE